MLDFSPVRSKEQTMAQFTDGFTAADLRRLTNEMIDAMHGLIAESVDSDVTFVPDDPGAHDAAAATEAELHIAGRSGI